MKSILALVLLVTSVAATSPAATPSSAKKGWVGDAAVAQKVGAHWFYNWGPRGSAQAGLEFVPMVKGRWHVNAGTLDAIKASGAKVLLGFNEPERADQGNLTVDEALDLWPQLMATGLRLGSPAPSSDGRGVKWIEDFMAGVQKRKLRVDFLAVHWYRSANAGDLQTWLNTLHNRWHRPIWVTEFNAFYTGGDRDRFAREAVRTLGRLPFVERFAYMNIGSGSGALWTDSTHAVLTPLGEDYAKY